MYKELYKEIVDRALNESRVKGGEIYYEEHHIVPDFMFKNRKRKGPKGHLDGDPDSAHNKVLLTFQEHLLCHYYLYEIYKGTRYEYSAGSSLQFFFVKATGSHKRQRTLTKVDQEFLNEMAYLRQMGIESIAKAKKGMMPVVDAKTKQSIGSVPVDHPKVLSGEWHHHSKGKPSAIKPENRKSKKGSNNGNYREMTEILKTRIFLCVLRSVENNHLIKKDLLNNIKKEFTEFKKISLTWITNNFGSIQNLLDETNKFLKTSIVYEPYYRSESQRKLLSAANLQNNWYSDGVNAIKIKKSEKESFLKNNPNFKPGRWVSKEKNI